MILIFSKLVRNADTWVMVWILEVLGEVLPFSLHVVDKLFSSWVFGRVFGGIVLGSVVNEGYSLGSVGGSGHGFNKEF